VQDLLGRLGNTPLGNILKFHFFFLQFLELYYFTSDLHRTGQQVKIVMINTDTKAFVSDLWLHINFCKGSTQIYGFTYS